MSKWRETCTTCSIEYDLFWIIELLDRTNVCRTCHWGDVYPVKRGCDKKAKYNPEQKRLYNENRRRLMKQKMEGKNAS